MVSIVECKDELCSRTRTKTAGVDGLLLRQIRTLLLGLTTRLYLTVPYLRVLQRVRVGWRARHWDSLLESDSDEDEAQWALAPASSTRQDVAGCSLELESFDALQTIYHFSLDNQ